MAWLPPELELGEEPELKPPELELELPEPEFAELEPEPVELEPEFAELEPEPAEPEPEPVEPEPELAEVEPEPTAGRAGRVAGPGQGQGQRAGRDHAGHGDRGGRGPDLGPAALPGRHGLADSVISACAAHVTHPAVAYSKIPARTFWASYEPGRLIARSGGRGYPGNMTGT